MLGALCEGIIAADVQLGVIGCGDVLFRSYLPGLATTGGANVVACFDPQSARAERAVSCCANWSPGAVAYSSLDELLAHPGLDGVLNLTPAPQHATITESALGAGLHVYSEKPLALTVADARSLIATAVSGDRLLMCAPAIMAAPRFRWLAAVLGSGLLGAPTLACAQFANLGPAALRDYTGDPAVHYGSMVGPLLDQGVYVLHAITGLLGPVRRVEAFGTTAIPRRRARSGARAGELVEVSACDHVLLHLELQTGVLAQVLSSFAVSGSRAPMLEIHAAQGSLSLDDIQDANAPVDVYVVHNEALGVEGWVRDLAVGERPAPLADLIALGPRHFVAVLRGEEPVALGAEDATHVLEITEAAAQSMRQGHAVELGAAPKVHGGQSAVTAA